MAALRRPRLLSCVAAFRSIASLSISFGLVSIPVKVYSATDARAAIRFKLLSRSGQRVRRRYVADEEAPPAVSEVARAEATPARAPVSMAPASAPRSARRVEPVSEDEQEDEHGHERDHEHEVEQEDEPNVAPSDPGLRPAEMLKAYEFEKGRFVTFTAAELKALAAASRPTIDIVSFIPEHAVAPIYYDKAYYLAPDRPASKPYSLLHAAMRESGRSALARWAWRAKEYVVEIRPAGHGFVLQQLLYADEVRPIEDLHIELAEVGAAELDLALRLIGQIADDGYDPHAFVDEEKQRILAAVERKVAGRKVLATPAPTASMPSAQVIDLVAALRASLGALPVPAARPRPGAAPAPGAEAKERKPPRRAAKTAAATAAPPGPRRRGRQSSR
jgi:DNA end-binding protein Ku